MTAAYNEAVKRVLAEVNKFLSITLKSEMLSKNGQRERSKVTDLLKDLFSQYDSLAPSVGDEGSCSSLTLKEIQDDSRNTTSSSHGSEEGSYSENIPDTTVKVLTPDADKIGFLEMYREKVLGSGWKKLYCVLHKNVLYYFKKPGDKKQQGAFFIEGYNVEESSVSAKKENSFGLVCPGKKSYQFCADNPSDLQAWKAAMSKSGQSGQIIVDEYCDEGEEEENRDDVYEPLDEPMPPPKKEEPKKPTPKLPEPIIQEPEVDDLEDDELIYEAVENTPAAPSPVALPAPRSPLPDLPLPPPPTEDEAPPPLPSREVVDANANPPALPKRNALPPPPTSVPEKKKRRPTLGNLEHPAEDFDNMFYGLYSCKGSTDNELNFKPGDIIHVINRDLDAEDWWIGELEGRVGLVPKTFLHPAFQPEL